MSVLSAQAIRACGLLSPLEERTSKHGLTYGLGPCGYDLRLNLGTHMRPGAARTVAPGEFLLAAAVEHFQMRDDVMGVVHDKSTLARRGLSVFNTVIEPGWRGFLTIELVNNSTSWLSLVQGQAIAQVVFHWLDQPTDLPYQGKYQNQEAGPQGPRA